MSKADRVASVLEAVRKGLGKDNDAIMRLDSSEVHAVEVIPTGSLALDLALGCGGLPRGRIIEIYGPESSGKTTLTLHAMAAAQANDIVCGFVDAEHALDVGYARKLGVKPEDLLLSQPDCGEQGLTIAELLVRSGAGLVVIDSVAALVPRAELEGDMGDAQMGSQARLMSQAMRKLTALAATNNATVIFINQLRMKIGVMFGSPETTTGGQALKFYASVRLDVRRLKTLKEGGEEGEAIGSRTRVKVVKNKMAPPFREAEFDVMYGTGINRMRDLLDVAESLGIVTRNGAWYQYRGNNVGQGAAKSADYLRDNPTTKKAIIDDVRAQFPGAPAAPVAG